MTKEDLEKLIESYPKQLAKLAEMFPPSFATKQLTPKLKVVKDEQG